MVAVSNARPPVYFIRHGETDWNQKGLIQGWTDTPLNATGHRQARAVGRALLDVLGLSLEWNFVVSPLQRARQTMAHVVDALSIDPQRIEIRRAVKELGFGVWEGKHFQELRTSPDFPANPEDRYHWRPDGGESYADGRARMNEWLDSLDRPTVVVSHGAIGRCLVAELAGLTRKGLVELEMRQGCYCRLVDGTAEWFDATVVAS